ncbi:hypothetical protein, partial [Holospora obtusa]|uniref:hypothetical protein n=1 Tax=Holospora obtusa TaxID=49893 RepID=UPI00058B411E
MSVLGQYYHWYVLNDFTADKKTKNPHWKDCTRYLAGFLMKVLLLNEWREYDYPKDKWTDKFTELADDFWELFEWGKDEIGQFVQDIIDKERNKENGSDHYPDDALILYISEMTVMGGVIDRDVLECSGIFNDLFIGRRDSFEMYDQEYCTEEIYDPSMNWPLPRSRGGPPYGRRPYLQSQDPPRSQSVIWVPFPILRFAFFAKEVAVFGRPFEGMQKVAKEQLEQLDGHFIHPEYFYILAKVLELTDCQDSRNALDILA